MVKIVLNYKDKAKQIELPEDKQKLLYGKKIGDKVDGSEIELPGYELQVTGGSDIAGFPMRKDVLGGVRKKILAVKGVGFKKSIKGVRRRRTVAGNQIYDQTAQVNMKVLKVGEKDLESL